MNKYQVKYQVNRSEISSLNQVLDEQRKLTIAQIEEKVSIDKETKKKEESTVTSNFFTTSARKAIKQSCHGHGVYKSIFHLELKVHIKWSSSIQNIKMHLQKVITIVLGSKNTNNSSKNHLMQRMRGNKDSNIFRRKDVVRILGAPMKE